VSAQVLLVVLFAAVLHAVWNAWVKASVKDRLPSAAIFIGAGIVSLAVVPFVPVPAVESWPYAVASVAVHCAYSIMLGRAYRAGDFSLAYPIMRGLPPLLAGLLAWVFAGERMAGWQLAGIVALSLGILSLALESGWGARKARATVGWALLVALSIGLYTVIDGMGGRVSGSTVSYVAWICLLEGILLATIVTARQGRPMLVTILRSWKITLVGGSMTLLGYILVVWAMTKAPIALVSALRETSVIFAALLGAVLFRERLGPVRLIAIALVVLGIFLTRLT